MILGRPNRLEVYLLVSTLTIYTFLCVPDLINHKDVNYVIYAILVFVVVLIFNVILSSIVNAISYISRELCSIYFLGGIALPGGMSFVLPTLLLSFWS